MKIVFVHYHLKSGGVSTVIKQQIDVLKPDCKVLVLTGEVPKNPFLADIICIPGLSYDQINQKLYDPKEVAQSMLRAISLRWKTDCDVMHVHNPTLAKNKSFLKILQLLKNQGIKFFLQIHDFAEDGRPGAFFHEQYISDSHYGTINSRDYNILLKAGLKQNGLHKIPNIVNSFNNISTTKQNNYILYPIRAIRRKNIGEAILLSIFFKNRDTLAITLPPNSPSDMDSYHAWKKFVTKNKLNVKFEVGLRNDFKSLVGSSKYVITTSITEGFGFSFLEPWTAGKLVWGRKLPDICSDFEKHGIQLNHMYNQLLVPVRWIGKELIHEKLISCIKKCCALYNYDIDIQQWFKSLLQEDLIDFGLLSEAFQKQIISSILVNKKVIKILIHHNPFLLNPGTVPDSRKLIQNNHTRVLTNYNKEKYRKNLLAVYASVKTYDVHHSIDKKMLLSEFFNPETFSLLKWEDYVQ
jgi:glycosyltransferase involved in cell wall biosynthesis